MSSLLNTAISGLRVSQSALSTTGHNISNAGVEGYSRQRIEAETNPATPMGGVYVGTGANVAAIERQVNDFLVQQLRRDNSLYSELDIYQNNINQLDTLLSDPSTGLAGAFESFFASVQNGADDPTSIPARQLIISEAENLADRFNTIYGRLIDINDGINSSMQVAVEEINALSANIAQLNQKIADAVGKNSGSPNDLLDQRDQALQKLSQYVSFQTYEQGFGEVNVLLPGGQNLVVGGEARSLAVVAGTENASQDEIVFVGDRTQQALDGDVLGGELSGLFRFRDEVLNGTYNELGRIAIVMADAFNTQNSMGVDLNNQFGGDMFFDINQRDLTLSRVIGSSDNAPPLDRVMSLNIADASQIGTSDYELRMINDGLYSITRVSDGQEVLRDVLPGAYPHSVEFDGLELVFERGSFQSGDEFLISPTQTGARDFAAVIADPSGIAFGVPLLTDANLSNQGSAKISAGELLSLTAADGSALPLFANAGVMDPPLLVRFTSDTTYEILDNSDPGNPVSLSPPIQNRRYVPGIDNALFSSDPGQTLVQMNGSAIGLPGGSVAVAGPAPANGYPSENITITRPGAQPGAAPITQTISTSADASARTTASILNNIDGVSANAFTYAELSGFGGLTAAAPLQVSLNGEDLIEYEYDAVSMTYVVAAHVPDPTTDPVAFNDYLASQINGNSTLRSLGIRAEAGVDGAGQETLRVTADQGDDLQFNLEAQPGETLALSDGTNPTVAMTGAGVGNLSSLTVGGTMDIELDDGLSLSTNPVVSGLFGDSSAPGFAQNNYFGIQASIRGDAQAGDTFTLSFNEDAASDNRNALAFADLQSDKTVANGRTSFSDSYASLVESVGIDTAAGKINRDAAEQVLQQTEEQRNAVSAVNLDEEAAALIRFEQMYSANAQVISVARDLFDRLINTF